MPRRAPPGTCVSVSSGRRRSLTRVKRCRPAVEGSANPMCCLKYSIIAPPPPGVRSTVAGARLLPLPVTNMMRAPFLSTGSKGALPKAVCPSPDSIIENRVLRCLCLFFKYFATTAATTHTMARSEKRN